MDADEQKKSQNETLNGLKRQKDSRWWRVINSPFVVTVIAGLLLTCITIHLQSNAAQIEQQRSRRFQKWEHKREAFVSFSNNFPKAAKYAIDYKYREIWIVGHAKDKNRGKLIFGHDGKSYKDTVQSYQEFLTKYCEINSDTLYAMVYSTFESEEVIIKARNLYETMNRLIAADFDEDVHKEYEVARIAYAQIIELMAREIKEYYRE